MKPYNLAIYRVNWANKSETGSQVGMLIMNLGMNVRRMMKRKKES